ncbi:hypothetical protein LEN26_007818 [Aphanomyces euteiches]|nr:hypothetical protein AeMF1_003786 [Aphanomyces euteiches]KAH9131226.1 hypothetical protein LEN26_007818 [Aphanomyces euteiches]KAH9182261.1 hypothetical protein AeNC1_015764 [Aphanomyces euteiches]
MLSIVRSIARPAARQARCFSESLDHLKITEMQENRAQKRYEEMRKQHFGVRQEFPASSQGDVAIDADAANRKRIIYRSKQRGWLEVDLLLGRWASENVMSLTPDELKQYEDVLNLETIDIFNLISGKDSVPEELNTPVMKRIQAFCRSNPLGKASVKGFLENKKFMSN